MDFWSRLLAGTPLSGGSRKDFAKDPARRLHRFEKEYSQLLRIWRNSSNLAHDDEAAEDIEIRLQEMTNLLSDESRRPLPHPCIAFAAAKQVYIPVAKIATTSYNEWIIKEAVLFFATLIESEEEAFVENDNFSASLTSLLVRITGAQSERLGGDTEARVMELVFNITTKIRLDPDILPAWFKAQHAITARPANEKEKHQPEEREKFAGKTQKQDFPLFYLLIDYIHHDGKVGDFARTGLLYVIEAASNSVDLEQWIVESDLSTLMATGLGALYSQLSRKLVIDHPAKDLPPVLALSDYQHPKSNYEIISSTTFEFQSHLETFLSHLLFWQDVLNHCRSVEVKSTLLEHFQVIFLQQLLYPSLLESSDVDGGSSVAVLTYLRRILESLDHPDMINLILHYLLALPEVSRSPLAHHHSSVSDARKRKSMDLATLMASKVESTADPLIFSLVDQILACLRSESQQTIFVTLQLVSVILKKHHRYAIITLLWTEGVHGDSGNRTVGAHLQEVEYLISLAGSIGGQDNFDEIYGNILKDTMVRLEGHPCSLKLVAPKTSVNNHRLPAIPDSLPGAPRDVRPHTIRPDDPLLNVVLDRLEEFFVNSVDTNLALTETLFDLAVCGYIHVEGWFLRNPQKYAFDDDEDVDLLPELSDPDSPQHSEYQKMRSMHQCRRRPKWQASSLPRLLKVLQTLIEEVDVYRETIPRFEDLLQQRREAFQTADSQSQTSSLAQSKNPTSQPGSTATPSSVTPGTRNRSSTDEHRNGSPARPSGLEGFAQRILSELRTPSPSSSPRSRKELTRSSSDRSSIPHVPPPQFPMNPETPKKASTSSRPGAYGNRSFSPRSNVSGSEDSKEDIVESQRKAFQAVDQSILARRVGIPSVNRPDEDNKVAAIPLRFGKNVASEAPDGDDVKPEDASSQAVDAAAESSSDLPSEDGKTGEETPKPQEKTASVSHVLTNTIILQSFLFELASLVQVRAALFDEVRFV